MQPNGGQDMGHNDCVERSEGRCGGPDLIGQGGEAEVDTLLGKALALAIERLMLSDVQRSWQIQNDERISA
jgi:hypothetical protein